MTKNATNPGGRSSGNDPEKRFFPAPAKPPGYTMTEFCGNLMVPEVTLSPRMGDAWP